MSGTLIAEQLLNGLQFGLMLFLIAAGLTLVFGILDILNVAHGSLYMAGAYVAAQTMQVTGSFVAAVLTAAVVTGLVGLVLERVLVRKLVTRDHLAQVLGTFAVILIANDVVKMLWGPAPLMMNMPAGLAGPVQLFPDLLYPAYRLLIIAVGLAVALGLYLFVTRTRAGVLVRAGASNRQMATLMGIRVPLLFLGVFVLGAVLGGGTAGAVNGHSGGHGRANFDFSFSVYRDWRHWFDTRGVCRSLAGRFCRYGWQSLFTDAVENVFFTRGGLKRRPNTGCDRNLSVDGDRLGI